MNFINTDLFLLDKAIRRVLCGANMFHDNPVSILDFKHCEVSYKDPLWSNYCALEVTEHTF